MHSFTPFSHIARGRRFLVKVRGTLPLVAALSLMLTSVAFGAELDAGSMGTLSPTTPPSMIPPSPRLQRSATACVSSQGASVNAALGISGYDGLQGDCLPGGDGEPGNLVGFAFPLTSCGIGYVVETWVYFRNATAGDEWRLYLWHDDGTGRPADVCNGLCGHYSAPLAITESGDSWQMFEWTDPYCPCFTTPGERLWVGVIYADVTDPPDWFVGRDSTVTGQTGMGFGNLSGVHGDWLDLNSFGFGNLYGVVNVIDANCQPASEPPVCGGAASIFWTDGGGDRIRGAQLDDPYGTVYDVFSGTPDPRKLALDPLTCVLYWTDVGADLIRGVDLDGSNLHTLVSDGLASATGLAVDPLARKIYWTDWELDRIMRANLDDGSSPEVLVGSIPAPRDIVVDNTGGKMYWTDGTAQAILRANLDGSDPETLVGYLDFPWGIDLDLEGGKVYWTDRDAGIVGRANLDGSEPVQVVWGISQPRGIAVDPGACKIYWSEVGPPFKIRRADLDGHDPEDFYIAEEGESIQRLALIPPATPDIPWLDVAGGTILEGIDYSAGVAWGDYDNDGDHDLYLAYDGGYNQLFRNPTVGGGNWVDVATGTPLADGGLGRATIWGDYDNDGDLDLYVVNATFQSDANRLFRNPTVGGGNWVNVAAGTPLADAGDGIAAGWGDYDNDGDLDLYLVNEDEPNRLFRNPTIGGGDWTDVAVGTVLQDVGMAGQGVAWGDWDNDGDLDLYVANGGSNRLFHNPTIGGGEWLDVAAYLAIDNPGGWGQGVSWGDYDNDGDLDLFVANKFGGNRLFRNMTAEGGDLWEDVAAGTVLADGTVMATSLAWGDHDNDGDLDLYLADYYGSNRLFRNPTVGGGDWADAAAGTPLADLGQGQGVGWADYDNDGDIDLYLANDDLTGNGLFENPTSENSCHPLHWLQVDLVGTSSNRSGIGARVEITTGRATQTREISSSSGYLSGNSLTAEFGLGDIASVDQITVSWPSGIVQTVSSVAADQRLVIEETYSSDADDTNNAGTLPQHFGLYANQPNPFSRTTTIHFDLPQPRSISLSILDVSGRTIRTLADGEMWPAGHHRLVWDGYENSGQAASAGVYFYQIRAGADSGTRRLLLLR